MCIDESEDDERPRWSLNIVFLSAIINVIVATILNYVHCVYF